MSELLDRFLQATEFGEVQSLAHDLTCSDDPNDVPGLIAALQDPLEARRYGAAYALGSSRRDGRAIKPLIRTLLNKLETPRVRAQAAESLGYQEKRKALPALIECSTDESAEVRFWCVFAMGPCRRRFRGTRTPFPVIRALEARLDDCEAPEAGDYWAVGLEALAMLKSAAPWHPAAKVFRETMLRILKDPLNHREQWQWAACYVDIWDLAYRGLFDAAIQTIHAAGFESVRFGCERTNERTQDSGG
jgi:hypothetical protein